MKNESKCKWRTLKIIDAKFLNVIANLFKIIIFRFILLWELFDKNVSIILLIWSTENYEKQLYNLWQLHYEFMIKLTKFLGAFTNL